MIDSSRIVHERSALAASRTTAYILCAMLAVAAWVAVTAAKLGVASESHRLLTLSLIIGLLLIARVYISVRLPEAATFGDVTAALIVALVVPLAGGTLQYAMATLPAIDLTDTIRSIDLWMTYDSYAFIKWAEEQPGLWDWMNLFYLSFGYQIVLAIFVLAYSGHTVHLHRLLSHMIVGLGITVVVSGFIHVDTLSPALLQASGILHAPLGNNCYDILKALRAGTLTVVDLDNMRGLISFPSYHMQMAIFLALAFLRHRLVAIPVVVLNGLMVVSTLIEGGHYLIDLIAGTVVALAAIWITRSMEAFMAARIGSMQLTHKASGAFGIAKVRP